MNVTIPQSFITQAQDFNVPEWLAKEIFTHKTLKFSVDKVVRLLIKHRIATTESKARFIIRQLWKDYQDPETGLMSSNVDEDAFVAPETKATYLEKARAGLESVIGRLGTVRPPVKLDTNRSIVCSDIHVPFHSEKALAALLNENADEVYVLADIIDSFAISRYRQTIDYINMRDELAIARSVVEKLAAKFKRVYLLKSGNHDNRALKKVQEIMPQLLPLIVHPTDLIASGLPNVTVISTVIPNTAPNVKHGKNYECDFLAFQNDIAFGHFENFSGPEALKKIEAWLEDWSEVLEIDQLPRIIFNGHIHRIYPMFTPKGRQLVSTGCMCKPMPYQIEGHGTYQPPTVGYTAFYRDPKSGLVDLNKTEIIYVGAK